MERDWFSDDIEPLFQPIPSDEPVPYQLTEQATAAIRANTRRTRSRRCTSRMPYLTIHGGQSW